MMKIDQVMVTGWLLTVVVLVAGERHQGKTSPSPSIALSTETVNIISETVNLFTIMTRPICRRWNTTRGNQQLASTHGVSGDFYDRQF